MSDLVSLKFEELDELNQKLYLMTKKFIEKFYERALYDLKFELEKIRISKDKEPNLIMLSFEYKNKQIKRVFSIWGMYLYQIWDKLPKDLYTMSVKIARDEFLWGAENLWIDDYLEKNYGIKLYYKPEHHDEVKNIIYNVSQLSDEELEKKISNIIAMYEFYLKEDQELYKCLKGEIWIKGYEGHIYK